MPPQSAAAQSEPRSGLHQSWRSSMQQDCRQSTDDEFTQVKCVLVGDGAVGKTSLVISYTTNGFPTEYVPTAYDNYNVLISINHEPIQLQLCDTAGQDDFDQLRPLCYPNTDVFILCFSIVCPTSFYNVTDKWLPEIRKHCPTAPVILVGTQSDLRNDVKVLIELSGYGERPITEADGKAKARQIGAVTYIECSSLTQQNLKQVFDDAVTAALTQHAPASKQTRTKKLVKNGTRNSSSSNGVKSSPRRHCNNVERLEASGSNVRWWQRLFCCVM